MSWLLYDIDGYVGDLASGGGWSDFVKAMKGRGGAVQELIDEGATTNKAGLIALLQKPVDDDSADSVRKGLLSMLPRVRSVAILTDGIGVTVPDSDMTEWYDGEE